MELEGIIQGVAMTSFTANQRYGRIEKLIGQTLLLCRIWAVCLGLFGTIASIVDWERASGTRFRLDDIATLVVWWLVTGLMLVGRYLFQLRIAIYLSFGS